MFMRIDMDKFFTPIPTHTQSEKRHLEAYFGRRRRRCGGVCRLNDSAKRIGGTSEFALCKTEGQFDKPLAQYTETVPGYSFLLERSIERFILSFLV